jgi:dihydrodipicolinate synthase/N-acetylneuraminate lyase
MPNPNDPIAMLKPRRTITGMSAILLPFLSDGKVASLEIDWDGFTQHVERTFAAGLVPAVNMDTGYANLITNDIRSEVLKRTQAIASGRRYVAGIFVGDQAGAAFDSEAYQLGAAEIVRFSGLPIVFQSFGLSSLSDAAIPGAYSKITQDCDSFLAFELGQMFAPFGKIYSLEVYEQLMRLPACLGAKHSSLSRTLEWQRLQLRDVVRPDFLVLTGNDLAIDMVMYGSDYLLGLSTFAPEAFAARDRMWQSGDERFYELNDLLQYLGALTFRNPVPAYKHSAAMFLKLRYGLTTDHTHPKSPSRPESDREILALINHSLNQLLES